MRNAECFRVPHFLFELLGHHRVEKRQNGGKATQTHNKPPNSEEPTMMQTNGKNIRGLALLTGGVMAASAFIQPLPAHAVDKGDAYKAGAVVLGAASAYLIIKGKTLPGAAAAAGAYYAYKKGRKAERQDQYSQYPGQQYPGQQYPDYRQPSSYPNNSYPNYPNNSYPTNSYPTSSYPTNSYPNSNYPSNSYPTYNSSTNYPSGGYGGQNSNCHNGANKNAGSGAYNSGYNQYPNDYRAVAPRAAASAPRNDNRNRDYTLR